MIVTFRSLFWGGIFFLMILRIEDKINMASDNKNKKKFILKSGF